MATRDVFSEDELAQLRGFPEPARAELIRYFTLAAGDEAFVRQFRGRANVLGAAVQLCTLPWQPACGSRHPRAGRASAQARSRSACSRRHAARDTRRSTRRSRRQAAIRSVIATLTPRPCR